MNTDSFVLKPDTLSWVNLEDADRRSVLDQSCLMLFPDLAARFLEHAETVEHEEGSVIVSEGQDAEFLFISMNHSLKRTIYSGEIQNQVNVSSIEPFVFIGLKEVLENKPFSMTYEATAGARILVLRASLVRQLFAISPNELKALRTLNSSLACRRFALWLFGRDVPIEQIRLLVAQMVKSPRVVEKRARFELNSDDLILIQSGSLLSLVGASDERPQFTLSSGSWFGVGLATQPRFEDYRFEALEAIYFHTLSFIALQDVLNENDWSALGDEPCLLEEAEISQPLSNDSPRVENGPIAQEGPKGLRAVVRSSSILHKLGFSGDISNFRFGGHPQSPFHSTLWNYLILFNCEVGSGYINKLSRGPKAARLSHFAAALEDLGFFTSLVKTDVKRVDEIPERSLILADGRALTLIKHTEVGIFCLDAIQGLVCIQRADLGRAWNGFLLEVWRSPAREILGDEPKVTPEKVEPTGKKVISKLLFQSRSEIVNLLLFKLFLVSAAIVIPSFLFGLVNQSLGKSDLTQLSHYYFGIGIFFVFQAVASFAYSSYSGHILGNIKSGGQSFLYRLYLKSMSLPSGPIRSGLVSTRLGLLDYAFQALKFHQTELVLQGGMLLFLILLFATFSVKAAFVLILASALALTILLFLRKRGGFTEVNTAALKQDAADSIIDTTLGIRSLAVQDQLQSVIDKLNEFAKDLARGGAEYQQGLNTVLHKSVVVFKLGGVLALFVVCKDLVDQKITPGEIFGLTLYLSYLQAPYFSIASGLTSYNPTGLFSVATQLLLSQAPQRPKSLRNAVLGGRVQFEKVYYRYSDKQPFSLQECSFKVEPGEKIAIVGRSGSGKSTLVRLIARQLEPTVGKIQYDDSDSRLLEPGTVQAQVGFVPQVPSLFAGSIAANIALGEDALDPQRVQDVAKMTLAHRIMRDLPESYSFRLGEFGSGLSVGQKQLIALARVLYADPRILVMDEVSAHLDAETEGLITDRVFLNQQHRTTFMVVQKISIARKADRILVVKQGRIVEDGDHDRLLALGGEYAELYRHQVSELL